MKCDKEILLKERILISLDKTVFSREIYKQAIDSYTLWLHNNSEDGTDEEARELIEQGLLA